MIRKTLGAIAFLSLCLPQTAQSQQESTERTVVLPEDPHAVVIEFDIPPLSHNSLEADTFDSLLEIRGDGALVVNDPHGRSFGSPHPSHVSHIEGQLSETQLQELLRFIIDEHEIFTFDTNLVDSRIDELWIRMEDANWTVVRVFADGQSVEARVYFAPNECVTEDCLSIPGLADFVAVVARLESLRQSIIAEHPGGD